MRVLITVVADFPERKLSKDIEASDIAESLRLVATVGDKNVDGKIEKISVEELDYRDIDLGAL